MNFSQKTFKLKNLTLILFCFSNSLPSILLYLKKIRNLSSCYDYSVNISEKTWIYYLEFLRNIELGIFHWPSVHRIFNDIFYLERLIPRLPYLLISNNHNLYFLFDAFLIFTLSYFIVNKISKLVLQNENITQDIVIISLSFSSIYFLRILFLEDGIPELWWSRNIVTLISFWCFIEVYYGKNLNRILLVLLICFFTHSYTYLLLYPTIGLWILNKSITEKKIYFKETLFWAFIGLGTLIYFLHIGKNLGFQEFQNFYGLKNNDFNLKENLKYIFLLLVLIFLGGKERNVITFCFGATCLIFVNLNLISEEFNLQLLHFRLYNLEWLASLLIISRIYQALNNSLKIKHQYFNRWIQLFFIGYCIIYTTALLSKQSVENNGESDMLSTYLQLNPERALLQKNIFDANNFTTSEIKEILESSCSPKNWYSSIIHLHQWYE